MAERFGAISQESGLCGCHVHVGVPDRETAVQVSNHLRPWLPLILAMTANSPIYAGVDTGHGSWRSIRFARWPSTGPTPYFDGVEHYDRTVQQLITAGALLDEGMVYWYARPSRLYPTIEVRVSDACPTVDDTVLIAALVRGLVATAIEDAAASVPAPPVPESLLSAAHWRAAHDGLDGALVQLPSGSVRPAWDLVAELLAKVGPALARHGDLALVEQGLAVLRQRGTGASRQRRVHERTGDIRAVIADLVAQTVSG
jgi:carboxylate-amine ligase